MYPWQLVLCIKIAGSICFSFSGAYNEAANVLSRNGPSLVNFTTDRKNTRLQTALQQETPYRPPFITLALSTPVLIVLSETRVRHYLRVSDSLVSFKLSFRWCGHCQSQPDDLRCVARSHVCLSMREWFSFIECRASAYTHRTARPANSLLKDSCFDDVCRVWT